MTLADILWPPGSPEAKRLNDAFSLYATQAGFDRWMDRCEKGLRMRDRWFRQGTFVSIDRLRGLRAPLTPEQMKGLEERMKAAEKRVYRHMWEGVFR